MSYHSLEHCLLDLEAQGMLVRISEEIDPYLEMAAIHLRVHEAGGPAILFEQVKGSRFRAASNLFGTLARSRYIFRESWQQVQKLIELKQDPTRALQQPLRTLQTLWNGRFALPMKNPGRQPVRYEQVSLNDLPLITHWKMDGGPFITLPQVYTEDADQPGIQHSNLGMYRIQLKGNDYESGAEVGLHYQLHRGIGVHQWKAQRKQVPFKVSCFVGGPPSHALAAVMPLPEGMSETAFAGVLGRRRFRYSYEDGYCLSTDADFVLCGTVIPDMLKPEGPFGDHLGYYSLQHDFPVLRLYKIFARRHAIWPFTVVGRPPQEDTRFGELIHELSGAALQKEIPGLLEIHAVDAAGVHPLLLAIGQERYTPYQPDQRPAELLTIANHILGSGQLSLAKYLFITEDRSGQLSTHDIAGYFTYLFQRVNWNRDIHFHTQTSIDTLDYSGNGLNSGSKAVIAACSEALRTLCLEIPDCIKENRFFRAVHLVLPGVVAIETKSFHSYEDAEKEMEQLHDIMQPNLQELNEVALLVLCDDAAFLAKQLANFLWVTFTRSNPSHDIYGLQTHQQYKHWGCAGPLIIDARIKPHHAPVLEKDPAIEKRIDHLFTKSGPLAAWG